MTTYILPPQATPSVAVEASDARFPVHRIYCVGRNYADHAKEMGATVDRGQPVFFCKPADAIVPGGGDVPYPGMTADLHHEVELVVALGQGGRDIAAADALAHIYGYAVGLDMTRRDLQAALKKQGRPWCIAKGFEASAPIGPLTPAAQWAGAQTGEPQANITLHVNGALRQSGHTEQMLCGVAETIAQLSRAWTLQPGDLIFTGTPAGVGAVQRGDVLQAHIDGLQPLSVRVV